MSEETDLTVQSDPLPPSGNCTASEGKASVQVTITRANGDIEIIELTTHNDLEATVTSASDTPQE